MIYLPKCFEYGYTYINAHMQSCLKLERCKPHKAARHPTKCDVINDVKTMSRKKIKCITIVPTKSDGDVIFCLQMFNKTLICTLHLSLRESRDHLCINPILRLGLIYKWSIDSKL